MYDTESWVYFVKSDACTSEIQIRYWVTDVKVFNMILSHDSETVCEVCVCVCVCVCVLDEILSHESETVQERILSLEKKLQQQDDEIVCLKSALADALRRLATLESGLSLWRNCHVM